jgi:ribonuclease P protein component
VKQTARKDSTAMAEKRFGLPREERIRKRNDFERVFREGSRISAGPVYARYVPNGLAFTRMAVAVPTGFGKAARRNRARRLLKEAYRLNKHEMPGGLDIIFLPGYDWNNPPLRSLEESMLRIARVLSSEDDRRQEGRSR